MLEGTFVTVGGFKNYHDMGPFFIGSRFICQKEPSNLYDDEAVKVVDAGGETLGYLANSSSVKANGTMSSARIYDKVGDMFLIEVCFTTRTKVICKIIDFDCTAALGMSE